MSHRTHIVFDDEGRAWKSKVDARMIDLNVQPAEEEGYYSAAEEEWPGNGQLDDEGAPNGDHDSNVGVDEHRGVGHEADGSSVDPSDNRYNPRMEPPQDWLESEDGAPVLGDNHSVEQEGPGKLDEEGAEDFDDDSDVEVDERRGVGHEEDSSPMGPTDTRDNAQVDPPEQLPEDEEYEFGDGGDGADSDDYGLADSDDSGPVKSNGRARRGKVSPSEESVAAEVPVPRVLTYGGETEAPEAPLAPAPLTEEMIQKQNRVYAKKLSNWTMSLRKMPDQSIVQAACENGIITVGEVVARRRRQGEFAKLLAELLSYDLVDQLVEENTITPELAREVGALMQAHNHSVPFNLVSAGLEDPGPPPVNPAEPPKPTSDVLVVLGLMFNTVESVLHFKKWYEDGETGRHFERDLVVPMLMQYDEYLKDNPEVRGIPPGCGSFRKAAPSKKKRGAKNVTKAKAKRRKRKAVTYPDEAVIRGRKSEPIAEDEVAEAPPGTLLDGKFLYTVEE